MVLLEVGLRGRVYSSLYRFFVFLFHFFFFVLTEGGGGGKCRLVVTFLGLG